MAVIGTSIGYTSDTALASSISIMAPAGYSTGDLLLMGAIGSAATPGAIAPFTPSGWTALSATSAPLGVFWKIATGSEPTYTVSYNAACIGAATIVAYPTGLTVLSSLFASNTSGGTSYTPTSPASVPPGSTVVLFAANISAPVIVTEGLGAQGSENINLPPSGWTPEVLPFGPSILASSSGLIGTDWPVNIGVADSAGSAPAAALTSSEGSYFYTAFITIGGITNLVVQASRQGIPPALYSSPATQVIQGIVGNTLLQVFTDAATMAEVLTAANVISLNDAGTAVDAFSIPVIIAVADAAAVTDTAGVLVVIPPAIAPVQTYGKVTYQPEVLAAASTRWFTLSTRPPQKR